MFLKSLQNTQIIFNMSLNGITLVLVPLYNGHRRVAELKIAGRRVKQR